MRKNMSTVKYQITKARLDGANRKPRSSHRVNILFDGAESPAPGLLSSVVLPGGRQFINSEVDDSQTMPDFHFVGTAYPQDIAPRRRNPHGWQQYSC